MSNSIRKTWFDEALLELQDIENRVNEIDNEKEDLFRKRDHLLDSVKRELRYRGIYESWLQGVSENEIAYYGEWTVEYVEAVIKMKEAEAYSARTGNAYIAIDPESV